MYALTSARFRLVAIAALAVAIMLAAMAFAALADTPATSILAADIISGGA